MLSADPEAGAPGLARIAAFALAGLLYYVARMIASLSDPKRGDGTALFDRKYSRLHICLGGKGSIIFRDIVGRDETNKILGLFQIVAGLPDRPHDIEYSDHPKHEVAQGLLVESSTAADLDLRKTMSETILGERLYANDKELDPLSPPPTAILDTGWRVQGLPEIRNMIQAYEKASGNRVLLDGAAVDRLCGQINTELYQIGKEMREDYYHRRRAEEGQWLKLEPIYIIALRALTAHLASQKDAIR